MNTDNEQMYGQEMSIYFVQTRSPLSDISETDEFSTPISQSETSISSLDSYSTTLSALQASNKVLETKMTKLCDSTLQLKRDIMKLQRHVRGFHHDLLVTWQADILTRLVEIVYTSQNRKLPGGFAPNERQYVDRWTLTRAYTIAVRKINQSTLWMKFCLPVKYYLALQKYEEIVEFRSVNPFRSECPFAQWLVSEKENSPSMFAFWSRLFPLCYGRTVEESSEIFPMPKTGA